MQKVIISVINDLVSDQRVHRMAETLQNNEFDVTVVGRVLRNSPELDKRRYSTRRMKLVFEKGPLFYAEYNVRLLFLLLFSKAEVLVSNDLDTLLANYIASKVRCVKLVYDSHEYFTEVPELIGRNFIKKRWEGIEKSIVPNLKNCITVCQSIADIYNTKYSTNFQVVRNLPLRIRQRPEGASKSSLGIPENNNVVVYQGALNVHRGIELAIEAISKMESTSLLLLGDGDIKDELMGLVKSLKCDDKIVFAGMMPFEELSKYTVLGDVGISFEEDRGLNYRYALPNKIFDYIQAEIPLLVSNLPEMRRVVVDYGVGQVLLSRDVDNVIAQINDLLQNKHSYKGALEKAASELCWENERNELLNIFKILR